jgi:hypothetical protein
MKKRKIDDRKRQIVSFIVNPYDKLTLRTYHSVFCNLCNIGLENKVIIKEKRYVYIQKLTRVAFYLALFNTNT